MKKFLLSISVMFAALTVSAQKTSAAVELTEGATQVNMMNTMKVNGFKAQKFIAKKFAPTAMRAPKAAPQGEKKLFYRDQLQYVFGFSEDAGNGGLQLFPSYHVETEFITSADGFTYVPLLVGAGYFEETIYLKGKFSQDNKTFTIEKQSIGEFQTGDMQIVEIFFSGLDFGTGEETTDPITFTLDQNGVYTLPENKMFGLVQHIGSQSSLMTFATSTTISGADMYPEPTSHEYQYMSWTNNNAVVTSTIKTIQSNGLCLISGIVKDNPGWVMGEMDANKNIKVYDWQVVADDVLSAYTEITDRGPSVGSTVGYTVLTYNSANDTYTVPENTGMGNCMYNYNQNNELALFIADDLALNITFKGTGTTGISGVTTENGEVVSTQYFDLSGRRVNGAQDGVSIKVMKYADGTSKAVKLIN